MDDAVKSGMQYFQKIGTLIGDRWKRHNYDEERFPELARALLEELPPNQHVTLWDVVKWATTADFLPDQADLEAKFGDPPLTVYCGRQFRIEALFWIQGTPAIHQHSFSGAFHVLHGSSIHTRWKFESMRRIESRLLIGRVALEHAELLHTGDTRQILSGNAMFHATYHLDRPTVSVVVRTLLETDKQPQYTLLPPSIAVAQREEVSSVKRQTQLLSMLLASAKLGEYFELMNHLLATKDAYSVFEFLAATFHLVSDEENRLDLIARARLHHPELIDALLPALIRQEAGDALINMHRALNSEDLRFFVALLRNVSDRNRTISLIRERYPHQDPTQLFNDWVRELEQLKLLEQPLDALLPALLDTAS
jgi:hypothetical protein